MVRKKDAGYISERWRFCTQSPPDLAFITKDGVKVEAHQALLLPLSHHLRSVVENSVCCGEAQVFVDGVTSTALEAAIQLVYVGTHKMTQVSQEDVVEVGRVLGLPFTRDKLCVDGEKGEQGKLIPNSGDGADLESYSWTQTRKSLMIRVPLARPAKSRASVRVSVWKNRLKIIQDHGRSYKIMDKELMKEVSKQSGHKPGKSAAWTPSWGLVDKKFVVVDLEKVQHEWWNKLVPTDPEINLDEVERRAKLDFGEEKITSFREYDFKVARGMGEMCQHDGCERRFYAVKRREEHEKTVHEGKGLKCDHCEKTFVTSAKSSLMRHMLIKHGISVKCTKCSLSFDDFNSYVTHRRQICNKQSHFTTAYRRNVERLGSPDPKFKSGKVLKTLSGETKCLLCGQITKNKNMARHMREQHNSTSANMPDKPDYDKDLIEIGVKPDPAKCNICGKKFKNVRSISRHMKNSHGESFD